MATITKTTYQCDRCKIATDFSSLHKYYHTHYKDEEMYELCSNCLSEVRQCITLILENTIIEDIIEDLKGILDSR